MTSPAITVQEDALWEIRRGDVLERLREMPDESVQCCITSPPYYGLRDYGVEGQIGLEATPEAYLARLVEVFAEVRRVLRCDGTLWLNLGDSYCAALTGSRRNESPREVWDGGFKVPSVPRQAVSRQGADRRVLPGVKPKDLLGIPWMVAFALRADGWYLRRDIIWSKPNPMPESVQDRPTTAHEYVFLLSKSVSYFYDAEAIRERATDTGRINGRDGRDERPEARPPGSSPRKLARLDWTSVGRNKRSVWEVATQPYPEAHFATFPDALVLPMVLAGSAPKACGECGAPWMRTVDVSYENPGNRTSNGPRSTERRHETAGFAQRLERRALTTGWRPTCEHDDDSGRCMVLDPFAGSGTTLKVAVERGRSAVGIELNPEYAALAECRLGGVTAPLFATEAGELALRALHAALPDRQKQALAQRDTNQRRRAADGS